jgi:hypothetical protein
MDALLKALVGTFGGGWHFHVELRSERERVKRRATTRKQRVLTGHTETTSPGVGH